MSALRVFYATAILGAVIFHVNRLAIYYSSLRLNMHLVCNSLRIVRLVY